MNDIDHVSTLIKLVFKIAFEKVEKSDIEKPIFLKGGPKRPHLVLIRVSVCQSTKLKKFSCLFWKISTIELEGKKNSAYACKKDICF